jgi:hypothetical protein
VLRKTVPVSSHNGHQEPERRRTERQALARRFARKQPLDHHTESESEEDIVRIMATNGRYPESRGYRYRLDTEACEKETTTLSHEQHLKVSRIDVPETDPCDGTTSNSALP